MDEIKRIGRAFDVLLASRIDDAMSGTSRAARRNNELHYLATVGEPAGRSCKTNTAADDVARRVLATLASRSTSLRHARARSHASRY